MMQDFFGLDLNGSVFYASIITVTLVLTVLAIGY